MPRYASNSVVSTDAPKVEFRTKSEAISDLVERDIVSGLFLPGARLTQEDLAERYGVSTTPVREALRVLEARGLVALRPHKTHIVATRSAEELADILKVREVVEPLLAERAAVKLTAADIEVLQSLEKQMRETRADMYAEYRELNDQFHGTIYQAARQPMLLEIARHLRSPVVAPLIQYLAAGMTLETLHHEHGEILDAAKDGDGVRLGRLTKLHLRSLRKAVIPYIAGRERP